MKDILLQNSVKYGNHHENQSDGSLMGKRSVLERAPAVLRTFPLTFVYFRLWVQLKRETKRRVFFFSLYFRSGIKRSSFTQQYIIYRKTQHIGIYSVTQLLEI